MNGLSRSICSISPNLSTIVTSFDGTTATWSPDSYRSLDPLMSNSMCKQRRSPPLKRLRFTMTGAKNGFFASNGLWEKNEFRNQTPVQGNHLPNPLIRRYIRSLSFVGFQTGNLAPEYFILWCCLIVKLDKLILAYTYVLFVGTNAVMCTYGWPKACHPRHKVFFNTSNAT